MSENHRPEKAKIELKTWIGWSLTIFLSVTLSWGAMNARIYATESEIAVLKTRISITEKAYDKQIEIAEKNNDAYNDIKISLIKIEGIINMKQDKRWVP